MNILELSEQEINRRKPLETLRAMGINPYPAAEYPVNAIRPTYATTSRMGKRLHEKCALREE